MNRYENLDELTVGKTNAIGCSPLRTDWLCSLMSTPLEWCPFEEDLLTLFFRSRCTCFILKFIIE